MKKKGQKNFISDREQILKQFRKQCNRWKVSFETKKMLNIGLTVIPNHACIFNKVEDIGKEMEVICSNDEFAITILSDNSIRFYRCEDLDVA